MLRGRNGRKSRGRERERKQNPAKPPIAKATGGENEAGPALISEML